MHASTTGHPEAAEFSLHASCWLARMVRGQR